MVSINAFTDEDVLIIELKYRVAYVDPYRVGDTGG